VVAFGRIIPGWMLALPRLGCINAHGSLLPKYRGAAPIQWAIARGESVSGVTTMLLNEGLDTGPMLLRRERAIGSDETAADVYPSLAQIGAELMVATLAGLAHGSIEPEPQQHESATLAPILTREDGRIDFTRSAQEIYNRWRGFQPWPGAWTTLEGKKFSVVRMALGRHFKSEIPTQVGGLVQQDRRLYAACACGEWIEFVEIQLEGKRSMAAADFLRGHAFAPGTILGSVPGA
jgi:methionyl-tRNA formyltransferase